jgi:hypothetical protein
MVSERWLDAVRELVKVHRENRVVEYEDAVMKLYFMAFPTKRVDGVVVVRNDGDIK